MQIRDAMRVLDVSRTTMMAWIEEGKFPSAEKKGDNPRDPWLIEVDDIERVRRERVKELQDQIARISTSAHEYGNGYRIVTTA